MIIIEKYKFEYWIEGLGCDCCTQGNYHIENDGLYFRWESNIQGVITKHDDLVLEFDQDNNNEGPDYAFDYGPKEWNLTKIREKNKNGD